MKKGSSVLLLIIAIVSVVLAIVCYSMDDGATEYNSYYGGDAYTGIQQAAAQGARNGWYGNKILCFGFGSVLLIAGLITAAVAVNGLTASGSDKLENAIAEKPVSNAVPEDTAGEKPEQQA